MGSTEICHAFVDLAGYKDYLPEVDRSSHEPNVLSDMAEKDDDEHLGVDTHVVVAESVGEATTATEWTATAASTATLGTASAVPESVGEGTTATEGTAKASNVHSERENKD